MKVKEYIIAIIDDDADDCDLLATVFRESYDNTAVLTFSSGIDFLIFLKMAPSIPHLVIADLYMPMLTGLEVITMMKKDNDVADIPAILLSTIKNELAIEEVSAMKNVYYYVKPNNLIEYGILADLIMDTTLPFHSH